MNYHYTIDLDFSNGYSHPPTDVHLTGSSGKTYNYTPAPVVLEPEFKVGDIVQIIGKHLGHNGSRGNVMGVEPKDCIRIGFGAHSHQYHTSNLEHA